MCLLSLKYCVLGAWCHLKAKNKKPAEHPPSHPTEIKKRKKTMSIFKTTPYKLMY